MSRSCINSLEGWGLLRTLVLGITLLSAATLSIFSFDVDAVRAVIRLTARISLGLFLAAFVASALHRLLISSFSAWLNRNRRQLGLAFAYSHLVHAIAIFTFWQLDPATFLAGRTPGSYVPGGLGYAFIIVMAATSFDATARFIGSRAWKLIHTIGIWYVFIQFCVSFGKRVGAMPGYSGFLLILFLAFCMRAAGWAMKPSDPRPAAKALTLPQVSAVYP